MGKPPTFIEPFTSPNLDHEAEGEKHAAPASVTKATYIVIIVVLVALVVLVGVGLHIPAGE
jgi:hypothetical protein